MKVNKTIPIVITVFLMFCFSACTKKTKITPVPEKTLKRSAITVEQTSLNSFNKILEKNKGKVLIVDIWAPWCPPCREEIPGFISLYEKYKDKNVEIIGIATKSSGTIDEVQQFVNQNGVNYSIYIDDGSISSEFQVQYIPTTVIYNKDGKIVNKHTGFVSRDEFEKEIEELLKK